jgi:putative sigma-54 modulation protein
MEIAVRTRDLEWNEDMQKLVERSIVTAVDRHQDRIERISVALSDLNGPRGGVDKLCRITADVRGAEPIRISESAAGLLSAFGRAVRRLGYRIGTSIDRRRRSGAPEHRKTIRALEQPLV